MCGQVQQLLWEQMQYWGEYMTPEYKEACEKDMKEGWPFLKAQCIPEDNHWKKGITTKDLFAIRKQWRESNL